MDIRTILINICTILWIVMPMLLSLLAYIKELISLIDLLFLSSSGIVSLVFLFIIVRTIEDKKQNKW